MRADQMPLEADLREKTQHGTESFPFQYYADALYRYDNQFVPQHWHSELEFVIAYGGEIEIQVWNRPVRLKSGEGILINANVLHSYQQIHPEDQCICPNIVFGDGLIAPIASTVHEKYVDSIIRDGTMPYIALEHGIPWQKEILAHLDIIFSLSQRYGKLGSYESTPVSYLSNADLMVDCFEMRVHEELTRIWKILYGNLSAVPRIPILNKEATQQIRIQKMLTYIHRNYMHPITLASIASAAAIGKSEAARCFRRYMNDSPISYLLQYRIAQAKQQLQNPHKNVVQICMECGFQSPSYFSKVFRRETGMTPVQYRQYPTP